MNKELIIIIIIQACLVYLFIYIIRQLKHINKISKERIELLKKMDKIIDKRSKKD